MKLPLGRLAVRNRAAFTLIELLAVMTIILVLAGLILSIAGSAQYNTAKARATTEIKALETALENYKTDNGAYPPDPNYTSTTSSPSGLLDPQKDFDPTAAKYTTNSEYLYQILSGYPVTVGANANAGSGQMSKAYIRFTPQQVKTTTDNNGSTPDPTKYYLIDPFGFSYGYSTINAATTAYNNSQSPPITTSASVGYNPTFDLWSTAGYAPGGKTIPSDSTGTPASIHSTLWIKNW